MEPSCIVLIRFVDQLLIFMELKHKVNNKQTLLEGRRLKKILSIETRFFNSDWQFLTFKEEKKVVQLSVEEQA